MKTYYMNVVSGDVQTEQEWKADFDSMTAQEWFGKEECENLHWLDDSGLLEVEQDENGEWIEV